MKMKPQEVDEDGPLVTAMKKKAPKLRIEARYDEYGDHGMDDSFRKKEKARLVEKKKGLHHALKNLTAEEAHSQAKKSIEKEMRQCDMRMMEYDDDEDDM